MEMKTNNNCEKNYKITRSEFNKKDTTPNMRKSIIYYVRALSKVLIG